MAEEPCIHVVEDDQAMRESLVTLLEEAGYTVCTYATAEDLLKLGPVAEPACVVSDVRMPGMNGLTLLRRLRSRGSVVPLVLITGHGDIAMAVTAMKAGATDFLEKPFEAETLLESIEAALRSRETGAEPGKTQAAKQRLSKLTSRESEVLQHLVSGASNKEAAASLGISPRTIEFHRTHIMEKTGAKGLPELVRLWLAIQGTR
jgi:two-component system, LuxR family, response regulator FixJ